MHHEVWPPEQVRCKHRCMSPKSSARSRPWMMTRCPSTIRTTIFPTFHRKPRKRKLVKSVFPQCLNPLFLCVFHDDFALRIESKESMQSGNRCLTERKRRKRRFCDQCCRIDVKERSTERYWRESEESQKILC